MMKMFLQSCLVLCMAALGACAKVGGTPAQGVFLMSNQADNEIGVWHSADDGSLVWNGRYSTGGVGYPKLDGSRYLYSENQGRRAVGVQQILPGGKLKVLPETATPTGPTPDAWNGAMGLAATSLSEQELFDLYDFKVSVSSSTSGDDTTSDCASSPGTFFLYALSTLVILSGFIN